MVSKKPRIVIIGAGMAGITAANRLCTSPNFKHLFDLSVVEGGGRIGGRINSDEFCGDRIEQGATWIHGIEGSPVYKIAEETNSLVSNQPWECMDGILEDPVTAAEGGFVISPNFVAPISNLFKNLMDFIQGSPIDECGISGEVLKRCGGSCGSVGEFLRRGLSAYLEMENGKKLPEMDEIENWERKSLEEAVFAMYESIQRTFTSADDLCVLDYNAERDYVMFPGEEITIAKGYSSVIEHLASVLPAGTVQLNRKVEKIEWNSCENRPVKLHFFDGTTLCADHVIVTVSLGVLKQGIKQDSCLFNPPLPNSKNRAISKLGYGVVNKVFLQLDQDSNFPFLQMVFHPPDSGFRNAKIPEWIRRTSFLTPIYTNSRVVLSWFTGKEALELESLSEEEIINGFSTSVSNLLPKEFKNGKFERVLRTQWGSNPLFLGSYSYIEVGSSIDDMDTLAEPLPSPPENGGNVGGPPLQILFAGEATHKTHYSTTHGAYFSGLREANRLLKHYNYVNGV